MRSFYPLLILLTATTALVSCKKKADPADDKVLGKWNLLKADLREWDEDGILVQDTTFFSYYGTTLEMKEEGMYYSDDYDNMMYFAIHGDYLYSIAKERGIWQYTDSKTKIHFNKGVSELIGESDAVIKMNYTADDEYLYLSAEDPKHVFELGHLISYNQSFLNVTDDYNAGYDKGYFVGWYQGYKDVAEDYFTYATDAYTTGYAYGLEYWLEDINDYTDSTNFVTGYNDGLTAGNTDGYDYAYYNIDNTVEKKYKVEFKLYK